MKNRIRIEDSLIELSASAGVITLFLLGEISLALMVLGVVLSLSIRWPFKTNKKPLSF
jgi:hypothetical protein